jgi:uncharacterized membrane protein YagU involved in acid resistance
MASKFEAVETSEQDAVEVPRPTVAPLVVASGMIVLAAGVALGLAFLVVGVLMLLVGLGIWVGELLPGRGHCLEPLATERPAAVTAELDQVEQLRPGMAGYRVRLPEAVHPLSAGVKGGVIGGLVMPLPAFLYGLVSGHANTEFLGFIWYPINLLAGMVLPGVGTMTDAQLEQFNLPLAAVAVVIHATISVVFGLLYGVLLPMLPSLRPLGLPSAFVWGAVIFPLLWTGVSYSLMGVANPVLQARVDWPWFIASQFVFGAVAAFVVDRSEKVPVQPAGRGPSEG